MCTSTASPISRTLLASPMATAATLGGFWSERQSLGPTRATDSWFPISPSTLEISNMAGIHRCSFVIEEIMIPVVECWAKVVRERGILLECHAQNILLEIDRDFWPRRVVHRDFDVWVDAETRTRAGLDVPFLKSRIETDTPYPKEQHYSLVYDRFMGSEL